MLRRSAITALLALATGRCFALYDPKPDGVLAGAQGFWRGSLTYRDYSKPDRLVTLPTQMFAALSAPTELVLHFVFDDGPSKTVFSYERISFDFQAMQISWISGAEKKSLETHAITRRTKEGTATRIEFERQSEGKTERHVLLLSPQQFELTKDEVGPQVRLHFAIALSSRALGPNLIAQAERQQRAARPARRLCLILRPAGLAPRCRLPLSSYVKPHGARPAPAQSNCNEPIV